MDFSRIIETLTPDMIERFTQAVETGKWPDGSQLTKQQKETCIQAIMLYNARKHDGGDEPFTVTKGGELVSGKKTREAFQGESVHEREQQGPMFIDPSLIISNKNKH